MPPPSPAWPDPAEIEIQPGDTASFMASATPFRLIDCRGQDEWDTTHIEGAELLPLDEFGVGYAALLPDPGETIVIHCHHGMRSAKAALFLRQKGYPKVWSMARGIEGWSLEVDPTVPRY